MGDLIPHLIAKGRRVEAYVTEDFWYDVGSTEKYEKLNSDLLEKIFDI
jgi:NDP-sugar pyrophosphorylase family protein